MLTAAPPPAPSNTPIRLPGWRSAWCCSASASLFNSQRARLASAVVIALTIAKVFVIDMSTLTGVYRALSFIVPGAGAGADRLAVPADPVPHARRCRFSPGPTLTVILGAALLRGVSKDGHARTSVFAADLFEARREEWRPPQDDGGICGANQFVERRSSDALSALPARLRHLTGSILALSTLGVSTRAETSVRDASADASAPAHAANAGAISRAPSACAPRPDAGNRNRRIPCPTPSRENCVRCS